MAVRVGFVGVGARSRVEMRDLLKIPDAQISAFTDVNPSRCQETLDWLNTQRDGQSPSQVSFFADVHDMLRNGDVDAVYVSLPPAAHGAIEHAIIDARKALFVEKPLATTMVVAREIEQHLRAAGTVCSVGYQFRYIDAMQYARQLLIGVPIGLVMAIRLGGLPGTPWWRVQELSGGMLIEQHTHAVDLMRFLAGDVTAVSAFANTTLLNNVENLDIADVSSATCRFANGAVGSIINTCAAPQGGPDNLSGPVHIVADGMTISAAPTAVRILRADKTTEEVKATTTGNLEMNHAFIQAVKTGASSGIRSPYADALKTLEVTYAAHLSSTRGGSMIDLTTAYE